MTLSLVLLIRSLCGVFCSCFFLVSLPFWTVPSQDHLDNHQVFQQILDFYQNPSHPCLYTVLHLNIFCHHHHLVLHLHQ
uniref:Transmembrane protein n=1 Tax=Medicago truncatula TaxID=3880 RepID=I3SML1_MEDTR|nr:unknown [Medicago truncatula]